MAGEVGEPRASAAPFAGGDGRFGTAFRRLAARRARGGVVRQGVLQEVLWRGAGRHSATTATERRGGERRGGVSRRAAAAGQRETGRRGVVFPLATAPGRRAGNRTGEGSVAPVATAGGPGPPRPIPVVRRFTVGGRHLFRTRRQGVVFPLATAPGRRAGNRTGEGSVAPVAAAGGSGAPRPLPVVRRFAAGVRRPLPTRRPERIVPFLAAACSLAVAGCSPETPGAGPAGEATRGEETTPAGGAGVAAETAAGDDGGAASLPRPELHPGMPGLLNEAEIAALGAARERALGEIAHLPEFGFGEAAGPERIAAWDIDIGPEGEGLPAGRGSVERGETLYRLQCVQCHGLRGEGADYEALAGRVPGDAFPFAEQWRYPITVGSYWPYATTLFDYIRRAMPQAAPGTLPPNDVYALTAYVLHLNDLLEPDATLDADSLPRIVMPARDRFVRDDRRGGPEVR